MSAPRIAVLVPCHNEEVAIGKVVAGFQASLPGATVYVYDNNSTDRTLEVAAAAGAVVRRERQQGKGNVVRRMFADVEADGYILVDGDGTYEPTDAPAMLAALFGEGLDMVTGVRVTDAAAAYRRGHRLGNRVLTGVVRHVFGNRVTDMLSGYRCFSRRFVKSFPGLAHGFETETEFTVHALELRLPVGELPTAYRERPAGSASKLRTYYDGYRILRMILALVQRERPRFFFGAASVFLAILSLVLFLPVLETFVETGLVPRLPTFMASALIMLLAILSAACGLILDTVTRGRIEAKRIAYLAQESPLRHQTSYLADRSFIEN